MYIIHENCLFYTILTSLRTVFALMIINKAGGLVYNRTFQEGGLNQLSSNDYLVIAGTFHGYESDKSSGSLKER